VHDYREKFYDPFNFCSKPLTPNNNKNDKNGAVETVAKEVLGGVAVVRAVRGVELGKL
jgi:hypothetical protein